MRVGGDVLALDGARRGRHPVLLVLRALGLGDLLTAVPALRALAAAFPDHRRVLAAPRMLAPLVPLIGPDPGRVPAPADRAVHVLVDVPAWVGERAAPGGPSAAALPRAPALAVDLHGRGPQSHRLLLSTGAQRLLAFAHRDVPESRGGPRWHADEHEVVRWCRLLEAYGIPADPDLLDLPAPARVPLPARPAAPAQRPRRPGPTLLHPGAASPARRWPAERWAAVARAERHRGRALLVTGATSELPLAREIAKLAGLPAAAVVAGRTDLRELAALVARAERVVCGDTGIAHLATAMRTPSVVLFGPTPPTRWGPPPGRPWHRALWAGSSGDPHAPRSDPGLLAISPEDVLAALDALPPAPHARLAAVERGRPAARPRAEPLAAVAGRHDHGARSRSSSERKGAR